MKKFATAVTALALSGLFLTGCSSPQSLDDACDNAAGSMQILKKSLRGIMQTAPKTPDRAASALTDLGETFSEQTTDVSQDDVAETLSDIRTAIDDYASEVSDYGESGDEMPSDSLLASSSNLTDTLNTFSDVCPS